LQPTQKVQPAIELRVASSGGMVIVPIA